MKHKIDENGIGHRSETDTHLKSERLKSDRCLIEKDQNSQIDLTKLLSNIREETDLHTKDRQSRADRLEISKDLTKGERQGRAQIFTDERKAEGLSRDMERHLVDDAIKSEWHKLRLAAEALLETERTRTNTALRSERSEVDRQQGLSSKKLRDSQISEDAALTGIRNMNQFLGIVSHDLRNPLSAISMSVLLVEQALNDGDLDKNRLLKALQIIKRNSAGMDRMIGDLLDVQRVGSGKLRIIPEKCDVCALLKECVDMFEDIAAKKSIAVLLSDCPSPIVADFDHDRILQVLSNLIGNAIKFTALGGKVILAAKAENSEVRICVSDTGSGIPSEELSHIFEEFSQLNRKDRTGLGLGLYISKAIVDAHGGTIHVHSEQGKGTEFVVALPISLEQITQIEFSDRKLH